MMDTPNPGLGEEPRELGLGNQAEEVTIPRAELLQTIERLKESPSLPRLRDGALRFREAIANAAGPDAQSEGEEEAVTYSRAALDGQLEQIAASLTLERAVYYLDRLEKSAVAVRSNGVNDINLNRWKEADDVLLDSLWSFPRRESSGVHSAGYWGNFVPQIPYQLMRRYTRQGDWVLDTFAGSGTTFIEAQRLGRNAVGVELQPEVARAAMERVRGEPNPHGVTLEVRTGDATRCDYAALLRPHGVESVQLVLMHPPYADIIRFSDDPRDLSNAPTVDAFLDGMDAAVRNAATVLDAGRYLAVVIGDKYEKGEWIPLAFLTMSRVLAQGFTLKSIIVKNFEETTAKRHQKELWRYRALVGGFYLFKHEYILLFRKPS